MPNSDARRLYDAGRMKDLETHMRFLDKKEDALRNGEPIPPIPNINYIK